MCTYRACLFLAIGFGESEGAASPYPPDLVVFICGFRRRGCAPPGTLWVLSIWSILGAIQGQLGLSCAYGVICV